MTPLSSATFSYPVIALSELGKLQYRPQPGSNRNVSSAAQSSTHWDERERCENRDPFPDPGPIGGTVAVPPIVSVCSLFPVPVDLRERGLGSWSRRSLETFPKDFVVEFGRNAVFG